MASSDDLTPDLMVAQAQRRDPEMEELLRQGKLMEQQDAAPAAAPKADAKPDPQHEAVKAVIGPQPSVAKEAGRAVFGGVRDAGQEVLDFVDSTANWLNDNFLNLRTQQQDADYKAGLSKGFAGEKGALALPEVSKNETTVGGIARSVTQFAVPFLGWLKAFSKAGATTKLVKTVEGAAAGAATDATAFDPHQQRLSNAILEWTDGHPALGETVFSYLASKPGDTEAEGRVKNVLEGLGLGVAGEMALRALKVFKARSVAEGTDPVKIVSEEAKRQAAAKEAAASQAASKTEAQGVIQDAMHINAGRADRVSTEGAAAAPAAAKPGQVATKEAAQATGDAAQGAARAPHDQPSLFHDMHQPVDEEAARLAPSFEADLKQRPAIAPKARFVGGAEVAPVVKQAPRVAAKQVDELVTAMKEGRMSDVAKTLDESDFNFAKIDTEGDVKDLVDGFSKVFERQYDAAKHGVQSFSDIKTLADQLGAGTKTLKQLYQGTDNLAARVFAHRTLLAASAEKIGRLVPQAKEGNANAILELRKHVALHASIQGQMKGVQTEVARALGQFRIVSRSVDLAVNERNALIEAMGGHAANIDFAQKLSQITDPRKLNEVTRRAALARSPDALFEAWVNGILSNPVTHATNAVGNSLVAIGSVAERLVAAGVGGARGLVFRDAQAAIKGGEVKAYLFGMMQGLKDALHISADGLRTAKGALDEWRSGNLVEARRMIAESDDIGNAWKTLATDSPVLDNAAFGTRQYELQTPAITADNLPRLASLIGRSTVEYVGAAIRVPGRALATTDELFKTVFYRGELHAQAYRKAASEGLDGVARNKRIAELVNDPTPDISSLSLKAAREGTFTSPLGKSGNSLQAFIANTPGARYIMPFVRTPVNIMKYTFDRLPVLNLMQEQNRAILAAGGPQADMLISRWATGGSLLALGAYLSAQGIITGGGLDKKRNAEQLGNVQAYSIKLGDSTYSFNRLDPLGMFFGLSSDFQAISGHLDDTEASKLATAAVLAISKNLVSKTYLSGLIDAIDTFSQNSPGKWQRYVNKQAGTIVPGFLLQVRKEVDPEVKEVWTMMDSIKSRIPGFSSSVKPHVNLLGEDVHYEGGLGPDIASPMSQMTENPHPGAKEVARLGVDLQHPLRQIGGGDGAPGVELNGDQYYRLMKILGKEAAGVGFSKALEKLVTSEHYKGLPEDPHQRDYKQLKQKEIEALYDGMKQAAVLQLISEDKDLRERFVQNEKNKGNGLMGKPIIPVNGARIENRNPSITPNAASFVRG